MLRYDGSYGSQIFLHLLTLDSHPMASRMFLYNSNNLPLPKVMQPKEIKGVKNPIKSLLFTKVVKLKSPKRNTKSKLFFFLKNKTRSKLISKIGKKELIKDQTKLSEILLRHILSLGLPKNSSSSFKTKMKIEIKIKPFKRKHL